MKRSLLVLLLLSGCDGIDFPEEMGAPPRPWPAGMVANVQEWDFWRIRTTIPHPDTQEGYVGYSKDVPEKNACDVIIPKASSSPDYKSTVSYEEQAHIKTHEMRHCTGQEHNIVVMRDGREVVVWLP